ncbi:MAG: tRNA (adenosine(37)-N6)-threonylcarbamoyltransferase complex ATPase subunit type 1 TsaE [Pirellulales bacterium]
MLTLTLENEKDTERLGVALADVLPPGTVVALVGTLGAGKTRLVQAVATALGVPAGSVTSPTFVLVNEYRQGRVPMFHFDTYRLKDDDEFLGLGPDEYFDSDGITFVEWADRVEHLLPKDRVEIELEVTGDTSRRATLIGTSNKFDKAIESLRCRF